MSDTNETPATGDLDIFANAPVTDISGIAGKVLSETFGAAEPGEKQSYINADTEGDISPDDKDFTTHTATAGAPPKQSTPKPDTAPAGDGEPKADEVPDNRRNRIWRQAVRIVVFTDSMLAGVTGWLHDRDPKEFEADKDDIKTLCNAWYDSLMEWGTEVKEEVGLTLVYLGVYGWDMGAGIIKRISGWNDRRKQRNQATDAQAHGAAKPATAKDPDPVGTGEAERSRPAVVRVCKHPDCDKVLGDRQEHFCGKAHNLAYQQLRKSDPDRYPEPAALAFTIDSNGKKVIG